MSDLIGDALSKRLVVIFSVADVPNQ